ncbi:MAG: outer membrane beta-barrel family protein [Muribaculaceae bacterium]|nr:outer membrane beta-barrel family protein [Muribaculaceae bacterium]
MSSERSIINPVLLFIICFLPQQIYSNEIADTVVKEKELKEMVVEAETRKEIKQGIAFYPTKREKKFATDAQSLLQVMALVELPYDPLTRTVTTSSGKSVNYFIDGVPATLKDLKAMNPGDVDRIEYLQNPTGGNFAGKTDVVNFIMKVYKSGGYTKLSGKQFCNGNEGEYSVISRLAVRNVIIDAYGEGSYTHNKNFGNITERIFNNIAYDGISYPTVKESIFGNNRQSINNNLAAYLKLNWIHHCLNLSVTGGWNWEQVPYSKGTSYTLYQPAIIESPSFYSYSERLGIGPYLRINSIISLPKGQSLSIQLSGKHSGSKSGSSYSPEGLNEIINFNRDRSWSYMGIVSYGKEFNDNNSLDITGYILGSSNRTKYAGSSEALARFSSLSEVISASFTHIFSPGTSLNLSAGINNDVQKINGKRRNYLSPECSFNFRKKVNKKYTVTLSSYIKTYGYLADTRNEVIQRTSELTWIKGNPDLKDRLWWQSVFSNVWNFSSKFSLSGDIIHTAVFHQDNPVWMTEDGLDGIVETLDANSTRNSLDLMLRGSLKLFNRRLIMNGSFQYTYNNLTGTYRRKGSYFKGSLSANWYGKNWSTGAFVAPPSTAAYAGQIVELHRNWHYEFNVSYVIKQLNLKFVVVNPFGSLWNQRTEVFTPFYSETQRMEASYNRNRFILRAVYTLSYGKKVSRPSVSKTSMLESGALSL